jgi:hypothetical protein
MPLTHLDNHRRMSSDEAILVTKNPWGRPVATPDGPDYSTIMLPSTCGRVSHGLYFLDRDFPPYFGA